MKSSIRPIIYRVSFLFLFLVYAPSVYANPPPALDALASSPVIFTVTLSNGSTNADVTALQHILTDKGFYTGPITGHFGLLTAIAVEKFQTTHVIAANGIVGPLTRKALNNLDPNLATSPTITPTPQSSVTQSQLDTQLNALRELIISSTGNLANTLSSGGGGPIQNVYQEIANSQKIDSLANTTITNPTITGGTTCVTPQQFAAMVAASGQLASPSPTVAPAPSDIQATSTTAIATSTPPDSNSLQNVASTTPDSMASSTRPIDDNTPIGTTTPTR